MMFLYCPVRRITTHLRSSSQEGFDGHEGLFAAKARSGERFFLRLSKYFTSL
jgi:hypothetical protein